MLENKKEEMDPAPLEALERAVYEIDALEAIYGTNPDDNEEGSHFTVLSLPELDRARHILATGKCENVPRIDLEIQTTVR